MATIRYARPRLITASDKRYRAYVEHFQIQRSNQRAMRPPRQRDIFGKQAENALRDWLTTRLQLADTRILEYEEHRGRHANRKYRELDALVLEQRGIAWVFEIKASRSGSALRRASRQLRETRDILSLLFPTVYTTILFVDTGVPTDEDVARLMSSEAPPLVQPETLDTVLHALPHLALVYALDECSTDPETIDLLRFTVDDIIRLAGAENLALDWDADEENDTIPTPASAPTLFYSTEAAEEQEPDNPLAAALRRAGLSDE